MQSTGLQQSVLDSKPSRILSFPLTVKQQLWLNFLLPAVIQITFYLFGIATDLTIGIVLLMEKHTWAGVITIGLTYVAPLICFFMHFMNPPAENKCSKLALWILAETLALILYPIRPVQSFAERFFWAVEALRNPDPKREEALVEYEKAETFIVENYLFIQGLVHAGPQAIFQLTLLVFGTSNNASTKLFQAFGVIVSLLSLSLITTSYQRYETQAKGSRKRVWYKSEDSVENEEPRELLYVPPNEEVLPRRRSWTKVMEEDNSLGKLVAFIFWFFFLLGRIVCLVMASLFFPWAVLGVCIAHYIFMFFFILPLTNCKTNVVTKILLSFVYIFCLIEVGIRFRKSQLFHNLFITFCIVENFSLSLLWALWGNWNNNWWYDYALYFMGITHFIALLFLFIYIKFFRPTIRRIQPNM
ncbi:uncharacterized protein LOC106667976 isoform X2 [Cimex lectularius]|nr:uncharacterized protein LOC106667976 isoform X2 [Cimex lectularius]XP_014251812.1 uncharacterized protein LOC106667976 isoform X2 [Cimex lectularius]XP_024082742.1 uncharacterized protein LOC106667976 isoform X2 [Cimex lectularius]